MSVRTLQAVERSISSHYLSCFSIRRTVKYTWVNVQMYKKMLHKQNPHVAKTYTDFKRSSEYARVLYENIIS